MEDNLRNVLIIISAIVISAIFIHGLWTIRKQKNPYKLKTSKDKVEPITRDFDQKGFDQDGVGQIKRTKNEKYQSSDKEAVVTHHFIEKENDVVDHSRSQVLRQREIFSDTATESVLEDNISEQEVSLDNTLESDWFKEDNKKGIKEENNESTNNIQFSKDELGDELTPVTPAGEALKQKQSESLKTSKPKKSTHIEPLYEQPVSRAKPERAAAIKRPTKSELERDQIEIDFDNQPNVKPIKPRKVKEQLEPQVIILSVVMPPNQQMFGAALLPTFLTLGLKYGEMNIFHRHEDSAGNGKVTFSLANILNPGSFDLDSMETFATRGVSLFMTLPNAGDSFVVFEQMLNAAKQLAQEFNAQILDDKRNIMTKQTEQHYVSRIREFDRLSRIAHME